jgi:hypothetical protein
VALIGIYESLRLLHQRLYVLDVSAAAIVSALKERDLEFSKLYEKHFQVLAAGSFARNKDAAVAAIDQAIQVLKRGLD